MDFDDAKENIQPLASGRNVDMLQASLHSDANKLLDQRRQMEQAIHNYQGDDPLELWYNYIDWIEQSCPSGGKESGLQEVLVKCLTRFENDAKYYQDVRMIRLYIKFINGLKEPLENYEALFKAGIGTMVADFYISWAYVADFCGNSRKADEIFRHGIQCNAAPKDVLLEAHQHFRYNVGQRHLYKDDEEELIKANRELHDRRMALASLRTHGRKATVGSIRTGAAVKNVLPGMVHSSTSKKQNTENIVSSVGVYRDENINPNELTGSTNSAAAPLVLEENKSVVRMLIDAARNQENEKEPGPWNKAHDKKLGGKLFTSVQREANSNFDIHEDVTEKILPKVEITAFKYPENFVAHNFKQTAWITPVTTEDQSEPRTLPNYNKCMLYPRPNMEFQLEELRAYYWFKRRGIKNAFTTARDGYWSTGDINAPMRQYPNFAQRSLPQKPDDLDAYYQPPECKGQMFCFKRFYNAELCQEFQNEEIMWQRRQLRLLDIKYTDDAMNETMCANSDRVRARKSFFPVSNRQSVLPPVSSNISINNVVECANNSGIVARLLQSAKNIQEPNISAEKKEIADQNEVLEEGAVGGLGFEIYEDTTRVKLPLRLPSANVTPPQDKLEEENKDPLKFAFKTPMPPTGAIMKSNKLTFELYEDDNTSPNNGGGYYDAEETCSTQQFNIMLKEHKMSTPKVVQKPVSRIPLQPLAMFLPDKYTEEQEKNEKVIMTAEQITDGPVVQQKQVSADEEKLQEALFKNLSTILETSEHGSSHTTAASRTNTKSSCISSPELDTLEMNAGNAVVTTTTHKIAAIHSELETVQERSIESMQATKIYEDLTEKCTATPAATRLQNKEKQKDMTEEVGNFSRFEQRDEDTAHLCSSMRYLRFPEDKTETMSKNMMLVSAMANKTGKFQEDKTETFTKLLKPTKNVIASSGFQEDKTETFSKLIPAPIMPDQTPAKRTPPTNVYVTPELNLQSPKLASEKKQNFAENPNSTASLLSKDSMLQLNVTPLGKEYPVTPKFKYRDSFVPEFSFISETQNVEIAKTTTGNDNIKNISNQAKNNADESFLPQLSMLEEQQQQQQVDKNLSIIPPTQPTTNENSKCWQQNKKTDAKQNESLLNNISLIESSQPTSWKQNKSQTLERSNVLDHKQQQQQDKSQQNVHMMPSSFIKDFSTINIPPSSIQFLKQSAKLDIEQKNASIITSNKSKLQFANSSSTLKFLNDSSTKKPENVSQDEHNSKNNYFEKNVETATQFNVDNSMIKNSTWLPEQQQQQKGKKDLKQNFFIERNMPATQDALDVDEMSIYYKATPQSPKELRHAWVSPSKTPENNQYEHPVVDFNSTQQIIRNECANEQVNPFSVALTNALLDDIAFTEYIVTLPTCQLQRHISRLHPKQQIVVHNEKFDVLKLLGEGAYGTIFIGRHVQTGNKMALKQEQPPNFWEYYICLEIQSRIKVDDMLPAYMSVDYALIGKNSSILISQFAPHGSLIQVCNKVKKQTNKHIDEYVVMHMVRELLEIIDHLHAVHIIHADIKADNFVLLNLLSYKNEKRSLQLIDFGVAIDMKMFQNTQQSFTYVHNDNAFKCVEMREGRPWTYQLDLFGLAGVIHVLLFGRYMDIEQRGNQIWMPKTRMPRYFHKTLWDNIFQTLLNVRDCQSMPDLQALRRELKEALVENEHHAMQKLAEFNLTMRT